jgi:hypothetical protein
MALLLLTRRTNLKKSLSHLSVTSRQPPDGLSAQPIITTLKLGEYCFYYGSTMQQQGKLFDFGVN